MLNVKNETGKTQQNGIVLVLFAVTLPLIMIMTLFALDFARYFIAKETFQTVAESIAGAGATQLSNEILLTAEQKRNLSENIFNPIMSTDPLVYLNNEDKINLLSGESRERIFQELNRAKRENMNIYNLDASLRSDFVLPAVNWLDGCKLRNQNNFPIIVKLQHPFKFYFPFIKIFTSPEINIFAYASASVPLCA